MKNISILGSTGSIGTQTLEVVRSNQDIRVEAMAAGRNINLLLEQIKEFQPKKYEKLIKGIPYVTFPKNLTPDAGFFAILDFTQIKGMKYKG